MPDIKTHHAINPRKRRILEALLKRPHRREELDVVAGASNSPQLISELRREGIRVRTLRLHLRDRDGRACRPGLYVLIGKARQLAEDRLRAAG